jgi:ribose 1,5-bisphosphokinase
MKTKIVLIVGASGVGKDTLLNKAKKEYSNQFNFVRRYITRAADLNEDNYYLDDYAFEILKHNSFFISSWKAHLNYYAIAKNSIQDGINIISISRSKISDFEKIYENVYTINISIAKEELEKRLILRARETREEIEQRLKRVYDKIEARELIEFDNSKNIEESKLEFFKILKNIQMK